ncbi:MAG: alpha-amylase, partial [Muribaculaceae bacterium]|nr:alpha-amylase [Muribaculaceae bacterium]
IGDSMLNFLENHDEVRFASREFADDPMKITPYLTVSALMSNGPYMIYYGQELGEMAHDNEGFAGDNNRSTIFDYWSYDTIRRWYNDGKCSLNKLTQHEKWLRKLYKNVLNISKDIPAFYEGHFFDLMYVNHKNSKFNPHRQYAFLRYTDKEAYLIIANFDSSVVDIELNWPELAIGMARLEGGEQKATDLLWNKRYIFSISDKDPSRFKIEGYGALILPLKVHSEEIQDSEEK